MAREKNVTHLSVKKNESMFVCTLKSNYTERGLVVFTLIKQYLQFEVRERDRKQRKHREKIKQIIQVPCQLNGVAMKEVHSDRMHFELLT